MLIQCTKKLLDELNIKPKETSEQPLFSWHANLLNINRRKTIVFMNDSNRYVVALHGIKAKDKKEICNVIVSAIRETLLAEGIKNEVVEKYLQAAQDIVFAKTRDRSTVAKLNNACNSVHFFSRYFTLDSLTQTKTSRNSSRDPYINSKRELIYPNEAMYKDLEKLVGKPIFQCKAIRIKAVLELEKHQVWRRLIVPYNVTFVDLHKILQESFNWRNYHLHDFIVYEGIKPVVNLVQTKEAFEYQDELPMVLETGVKISEYIPKYKHLKYSYDFGDGWEHTVKIEDFIFDYDKNYPVCLEGGGNTPPEDVGGEGGYDEFLEIINDPKHEEYQHMKDWADMQLYSEFNVEQVNRVLKWLLYR